PRRDRHDRLLDVPGRADPGRTGSFQSGVPHPGRHRRPTVGRPTGAWPRHFSTNPARNSSAVTALTTDESPTCQKTSHAFTPAHIGVAPRLLASPAPLRDEALGQMRDLSPLRYPGAKSGLANVIARLVTESSKSLGRPQLFVEPFAGGASTSLR